MTDICQGVQTHPSVVVELKFNIRMLETTAAATASGLQATPARQYIPDLIALCAGGDFN